MGKKLTKITNISKTDLDQFISTEANDANEKYKIDKPNQILHMRETKLIPLLKLGSEMALTSVFLSSLRLVKEFRKMFLQASDIISSGKMHVYTEVEFPNHPDSRVDGLILIEKGGVIKDAAILEMKNGNNDLEQEQVERYIKIAEDYSIPKVITISNQFVSDPTQSPLNLKKRKDVTTYHFSWTSLLTFANILIVDNDTNIEDEDQVEIMKEVINYFDHPSSGVLGFNIMKTGWKNIADNFYSNKGVKSDNTDLEEAVESWIQEEKNMALLLSRELGILVTSGGKKYQGNFQARIDDEKKKLIEKERLSSRLIVKDAISPLDITAYFRIRGVEMSVLLTAPEDKGLKGQIGWLKSQLDYCKTKDKHLLYKKVFDNLSIDLILKNKRKDQAIKKEINELDDFEDIKKETVKEFEIKYFINFEKKFSSKKLFITSIEEMLIDFYSGIIQHLKKWEKPAPKVIKDNLINSGAISKNQKIKE